MAVQQVDVKQLIDEGRFSPYQMFILGLCFLLALLDGYDAQALGAIAPAVIPALHLTPQQFGFVFSVGGIGVLVGTLAIGMLADRFGRKSMLALSACIFGAFSIAMAYSRDANELTIYRFISSLGLGGCVPNALSMAAEYAPKRMKSAIVTILWAGLPAGGIVAGFTAPSLVANFGWPSVYIVGGVLPLVLVLVILAALPESLAFHVALGRDRDQIVRILRRLAPATTFTPDTQFVSNETKLPGAPVQHLFTEGRAVGTLLIWTLFFLSFCSMLTMVAWSSAMVKSAGFEQAQAISALGWFNVGSITASVTVGALIDRFGPFRILTLYFLAMAVAIGCVGFTLSMSFAAFSAMYVVVGFFTGGSNSGIMALGTLFYPVTVRGTGVGWAYAWGRVGATVGPLIGGLLVAGQWNVSSIYLMIAIPALIAVATTLVLKSLRGASQSEALAAAE